MNTSLRKLRTLGWFVQAIGIVAVVFIVVLVKRFGKFEAQLGLAVSRSIIEAHDGQLWAENNPDYGAKFSVKLPCGVRQVPRPKS
jgi:signal transduction histidine kinase